MGDIEVDVGSMRYRGTMKVSEVIKSIEGWLKSRDYKFAETKQKHKPDEVEMTISGKKKIHEYAEVWVTVELAFWDLEDVELIRHGQKEKMQDGYAQVEISGKVTLDPYKRFKGSEFLQKVADFMNANILKKDIYGVWKDNHYYELLGLHKHVKEVLELETPVSAR